VPHKRTFHLLRRGLEPIETTVYQNSGLFTHLCDARLRLLQRNPTLCFGYPSRYSFLKSEQLARQMSLRRRPLECNSRELRIDSHNRVSPVRQPHRHATFVVIKGRMASQEGLPVITLASAGISNFLGELP